MASSVLPRVRHGYPADRPSRRAEQRDDRRRTHLIKVVGNGDFGHETDPRCPRFITNRNDSSDWAPIPRDDELFVHQAGQVGLCFVHVDDPNHACHPSSPRPIGLVCLVYLCSGGTARPWNEAPLPAAGSDSFANMPSDQISECRLRWAASAALVSTLRMPQTHTHVLPFSSDRSRRPTRVGTAGRRDIADGPAHRDLQTRHADGADGPMRRAPSR